MYNLISKAKTTTYKHKDWFVGGEKTVYEAMEYFVDSGMFSLQTTAKYVNDIPGYTGSPVQSDIVDYLIEKRMWELLKICYLGKEKGTDRGKLKVLTYIAIIKQRQSKDIKRLDATLAKEYMRLGAMVVEDYFTQRVGNGSAHMDKEALIALFKGETSPFQITFSDRHVKWLKGLTIRSSDRGIIVTIQPYDRYEEELDFYAKHWIELVISPERTIGCYIEKHFYEDKWHTYEEFGEELADTFAKELPTWLTGRSS